jgi:hypothetical protein
MTGLAVSRGQIQQPVLPAHCHDRDAYTPTTATGNVRRLQVPPTQFTQSPVCHRRRIVALRSRRGSPFRDGRGIRVVWARMARERAAELGKLTAEAARALGCGGAALGKAEQLLRDGMSRIGGEMLSDILSGADAIITLRAEEASRRWNETRNPDATQTHTA